MGATIECYNPADTRERVSSYQLDRPADVAMACDRAVAASESWARTPGPRRAEHLFAVAGLLDVRAERIAGEITVIKPASRAPGGTVALAQALHDAGIPEDVFQVVPGGAAVGQALVGRAAQTGVLDAIRHGVEHGATVVAGGGDGPDEHGCYVDPTVVVGAEPGTPMIDAEVFGPVAAVVKAADVNEAIALANATPFGVSASVCTNDLGSALEQGRAAIEFFTEGQTVYLEAAPGGSAG